MTLIDLKGLLGARQGNLQAQLLEHEKQVLCLESDLAAARKAAAVTEGGLRATAMALADVEEALKAASKPAERVLPSPGSPPGLSLARTRANG
ncbi:MAG: hypothetical protein JNK23_10705 [Opitutaceae bacterium]|nr:hypothetical protein [Opitutaceae bacterium]